VSLRQNGVGPKKNCADAILPKGHEDCVSLQDESNGNILKINSTNGQYPFTRCEGITLIESRLKKAAALSSVSSQSRGRRRGQEHETIPVPVPAHKSAECGVWLPAIPVHTPGQSHLIEDCAN